MAELVQSIRIEFDDAISAGIKRATAQTKGFNKKLNDASESLRKMGKQANQVGKSMSIGLTAPIIGFGVASVRAFDKQAKAIAQLEAGLESTGGTVGFTSKRLQEMASELQNITTFGDEEILKDVTAQMLTFTNITGEQFARTQKAALDLATRLDGDLKGASIQLGKALNDPIANLSALSRSGIQFSEDQKEVIKALTEAGRIAEAQTLILDELEKQYGGSAEAAAKAGLGPFKQLSNSIGDLTEEFGDIIATALTPFIDKVKVMVKWFGNLSPETKKMIVIVGALASAIGPLLIAFGSMSIALGALMPIITGIGVAFTTVVGILSSPVIAVIGLVALGAYTIIESWSELKAFFNAFWDGLVASIKFADEFIQGFFGFSPIEKIKNAWEPIKEWFSQFFDSIVGQFKRDIDQIKEIISSVTTGITAVTDKIRSVTGGASELGAKAREKVSGFFDSINPFGDDEEEITQPTRSNAIANQSNINNNNNNVTVNLAVDKHGNPVLESAQSDNGLNNLDINTGLMIP
jgi:hypothetical protein